MTALILLVQVVLPLLLLGWLAFWPAGSALGWLVQAAGVAAILFALARIAQWALPVWWLPWVYGAVWLGLVLVGLAALSARPLLPAGTGGWALLALSSGLLGLGGLVRRAGARRACAATRRGDRYRQSLRAGAFPCGPRRVEPAGQRAHAHSR